MTTEKTEELPESPAGKKLKLSPVIILSIVSGVLLLCLIGGGIYHVKSVQSGKDLLTKLAANKEELKRKTLQLSEAEAQNEALSAQMHKLKEFSANKAAETAACEPAISTPPTPEPDVKKAEPVPPPAVIKAPVAGKAKAEASQPPVAVAPPAPVEPATKPKPVSAPPAKKSAPVMQDCQLVGKSAEEQAATLKRCMQSLDR